MKTIKQLEKNILKFVNFPKEDNKILSDMLNKLVEIKTNEIIKLIECSHFLRGYEIFRGSTRINEKEIKQKLLTKLRGEK